MAIDYRKLAWHDAKNEGLDPDVFVRQINQESGFNPAARSGAGAIGIAQIMPGTATGWHVDPTDPVAALRAAAHAMAGYVKQYGGERNALIAYNAGPGAIGGSLPSETQNYINTILGGHLGQTSLDPVPSSSTPVTSAVVKAVAPKPAVDNTPTKLLQTFAQMNAAIGQQPWLGPQANAPLQQAQASPMPNLFTPMAAPTPVATPTPVVTPSVTSYTTKGTTTPSSPTKPTAMLGHEKTFSTTYGGVTEHIKASTTIPRADPAEAIHLKGLVAFNGVPVAAWLAPALEYGREHGWKGGVSEGYRTDAQQAAVYRSGVRPAAIPKSMGGGGSNHSFDGFPGGAVDVTDPQTLSAILLRSPWANFLVYAGGKDPVHFSHPHDGHY